MSYYPYHQLPPFCSMARATGQGETWTHSTDAEKFKQFGWRSTNNENSYSHKTLVGNWNEERFAIEERRKSLALPSQYGHYFRTTYGNDYNTMTRTIPAGLKYLADRPPHAHPALQPELDTAAMKAVCNSWETTSRAAYVVNPRPRTQLQ